MPGDCAGFSCAIGGKRLFDKTQHWIVDHSPFHMNAPDMSACVGPVLFRHDPPQCGEVGGFGARSDDTAIEPANHRENRSEFGLAHIQKGAVLGDALDCARRMVGPDLHTTAPARSEEHTSELQSL